MTAAGTAGGAIGGTVGEWGGGILRGMLGELFGPEAVYPGVVIGRRVGRWGGQLAGTASAEWLAQHMSHANEEADKGKEAASDQAQACSDCGPPLRPPNDRRHDPCKVKSSTPTKENNSMVDPDYRDQVNRDIDAIQKGQVPRQGENWTTNGRTFREHDGTLYPRSGPGIVELPNRLQHQLLGQLNSNSYQNAMKFGDNFRAKGLMSEQEFQQVMDLWNKCPKPMS